MCERFKNESLKTFGVLADYSDTKFGERFTNAGGRFEHTRMMFTVYLGLDFVSQFALELAFCILQLARDDARFVLVGGKLGLLLLVPLAQAREFALHGGDGVLGGNAGQFEVATDEPLLERSDGFEPLFDGGFRFRQ